jgi:diadenylate cyclase
MELITAAAQFIVENVRTMGLADLLDIALVAFLIYKLFRYFSRTGAARVVRGVLLLILVMWVASLLNMTVVNFLIGQTFQMGILAVIILFQPELRQLLERMGSSDLTKVLTAPSRTSGKDTEQMIAAVTTACESLAKTNTGALIVIARKNRIDEQLKTGVQINANITTELLENIFFKNTPLHDGAVLIRDNRAAAAACMLPLSTNPNIDRNLGTRHRAGIGMSEVSDAVVVIVSEETGHISGALGGQIKRKLSAETLRQFLKMELIPDESSSQGIFGRLRTAGKKSD